MEPMDLPIDGTLLRRVLGTLPEFILIVDRDRVIRYINRVEPGYDPEEVVGMRSTDVLFPESRDVLDAAMDRVFAGGEAAPYEVRALLPDGSEAWYGGEITPIVQEQQILGAVIRADNITELKAVQDELAQVRKLLPMCAWCGRIQTEDGTWEGISSYLNRVSEVDVTHGLCPECEEDQVSRAEGA